LAVSFGTGALQFELVDGWQQRPEGFPLEDLSAVATDSEQNVYLYGRAEHPITVYDRRGKFIRSWGEGRFSRRSHGIFITPKDELYLVDDGINFVGRFSLDGELEQIVGPAGIRSDTGYRDGAAPASKTAGPYNSPTNVWVAGSGDIYVSDGYRNAAVHRFDKDGRLLRTWGKGVGSGPGQFRVPHGIGVSADGKVYVADRENDRVQIFTTDGSFLGEWLDIQRPQEIAFDAAGLVYVAELSWFPGETSTRLGPITSYLPARMSIFTPEGELLLRWSDPDSTKPGYFIAPHDVWVGSDGALYVAEVTEIWSVPRGFATAADHRLQKFVRV
jgi:DNA-binding beta-propeller fold protein YncE